MGDKRMDNNISLQDELDVGLRNKKPNENTFIIEISLEKFKNIVGDLVKVSDLKLLPNPIRLEINIDVLASIVKEQFKMVQNKH